MGNDVAVRFVKAGVAFRLAVTAKEWEALLQPVPGLPAGSLASSDLLKDSPAVEPIASLATVSRRVTPLVHLVEIRAPLDFNGLVAGRIESPSGTLVAEWKDLHRRGSGSVYVREIALETGVYWLILAASDQDSAARYRQGPLLRVE